jgi:hypothetical protein
MKEFYALFVLLFLSCARSFAVQVATDFDHPAKEHAEIGGHPDGLATSLPKNLASRRPIG